MRRYVPLVFALSTTGCVTTAAFQAQQAQTQTQKKRADALEKRLDDLTAADAALKAQLADTEGKLKTRLADAEDRLTNAQEQLAVLHLSNQELQSSLEAKKGELSKKFAELIKEKGELAQKIADASEAIQALNKKLADAESARTALDLAKQAELDQMKKNYEELAAGLKSEISAGEITITQLKGKLTVNLVDRILFASGSAEVKAAGKKVLDQIAGVLNNVQDKDIRIEGHTDDVPISSELQSKYATNWELSTARAAAVARYLQDHAKADPKRLAAAGYGEFRPIAPNDTPEGRAQNRRIEIVLTAKD